MIVLLPPSEGKAPGGRGTWTPDRGAFASLAPERRAVVEAALVAVESGANVFGAHGALAERAEAALRDVAAGRASARPAWQRFTGVVWEHLDAASLPPDVRRRLVVPNAQLGLVRGDDPVPDFRLKFGISLPGLGRLDRWWRPALTAALARTRGPLVDLLPREHAAAVDLDGLGRRRVVRVDFVAADGRAAAGHAAKAVKGVVARTVLTHGLDAAGELRWEGWEASPRAAGIVVRAPA